MNVAELIETLWELEPDAEVTIGLDAWRDEAVTKVEVVQPRNGHPCYVRVT